MWTVTLVLVVSALILTLLSKAKPDWDLLWVAVLLLALVELLRVLPKG